MIRPYRPGASDINLLFLHGVADLLPRTSHVHHELVRYRGHVLEFVLVHESEDIGPDVGDELAAFGDEGLVLQTGGSGGHSSDGERAAAKAGDLLEQIGARHRSAGADARHAVNLGEGSKDDNILVLRNEVGSHLIAGDVNVRLVEKNHAALWFVLDQPLDIGARGDRAGRVVGIAKVDETGIRAGGRHLLYIVRIGAG